MIDDLMCTVWVVRTVVGRHVSPHVAMLLDIVVLVVSGKMLRWVRMVFEQFEQHSLIFITALLVVIRTVSLNKMKIIEQFS